MPVFEYKGVSIRIVHTQSNSRWRHATNEYFDVATGEEYDGESLGPIGRGHAYTVRPLQTPDCYVLENTLRAWDAEGWELLSAVEAWPGPLKVPNTNYGPGDFRTSKAHFHRGKLDAAQHLATLRGWDLRIIQYDLGTTSRLRDCEERLLQEKTHNHDELQADLKYLKEIISNPRDPGFVQYPNRYQKITVLVLRLESHLGLAEVYASDEERMEAVYDFLDTALELGDSLALVSGGVRISFPMGSVLLRSDAVELTTDAGTSIIGTAKKKSRLKKIRQKQDTP